MVGKMSHSLGLFLVIVASTKAQYLNPPYFNLAEGKNISATATCGISDQGRPMTELYCSLAATPYNPYSGSYFSYNVQDVQDQQDARLAQLRASPEGQRIVQGGQSCQYCDGEDHGAVKMVDGTEEWWQSPPLSRGFHYNNLNITISLQQEFHVAYVSVQMANSPRPGAWVLERSRDHGKTWETWQYFAQSAAQCQELFGPQSLAPLLDDDSVICSTDNSHIVPLENGEIYVRLLAGRPSRLNFSHSETLQQFTRATDVRLRLLKTNTLQGHLMDLARQKDPTITRRYFYSIKEIEMGGRCVCNGHAQTCDILDPRRPTTLLCRCEHNTCGDQCGACCPGFQQKAWRPSREGHDFVCEPCNCFGHSNECEYDDELADKGLSLDIHGKYDGGGRCLNCQHNTEGINCHECAFGYYRPTGNLQNQTDACQTCSCDPFYHNGNCRDGDGKCFCKANFAGPDCDSCAPGYHDFAAGCPPCDCNVNGTDAGVCLPDESGACPCKNTFGGKFCDQCSDGYYSFPECKECTCEDSGSLSSNCSKDSGQCPCKGNFAGLACDKCALGYYNYPTCDYCKCDPSGTEAGICDGETGQCLCRPGYGGERCDKCLPQYYGYPDCKLCDCAEAGSESLECEGGSGQCTCRAANYTGRRCEKCAAGFYGYPDCHACQCDKAGSQGSTCGDDGACYCKPNFAGRKCSECRANFYNYPICEECNCNPAGVTPDFAGCDSVPPGQLCTCKARVTGRSCDRCEATFWNLQYHHPEGCEDCDCYRPGTASRLNDCASETDGQCPCKAFAHGRTCSECADGYYQLSADNAFACTACECDVGGAFLGKCDAASGQCRCRPRIEGKKCTRPIREHYYPHLHHMGYEAEDGRTEGTKPVRMATDDSLFANFSWKGYAVFSPIQSKIMIDVDIPKANIYRVLFHYVNPTKGPIKADVSFTPYYTESEGNVEQKIKVELAKTDGSTAITTALTSEAGLPHPFVLNPGKWILTVTTKQRLFLDNVVLLPSAYFEGTVLKERTTQPCPRGGATGGGTCLDLVYPDLPDSASPVGLDVLAAEAERLAAEGEELPERVPLKLGGDSGAVAAVLNGGPAVLLLEYATEEGKADKMVEATVQVGDTQAQLFLHPCPYMRPCREVVSRNGVPAEFNLDSSDFTLSSTEDFSLELVRLDVIPVVDWNNGLLIPKPRCVRRQAECLVEEYRNADGSITVEAAYLAPENSKREEWPFGKNWQPLSSAEGEKSFRFYGDVPMEGHFNFMLLYINPDLPKTIPVHFFSDKSYKDLTGSNLTRNSSVPKDHVANAEVRLEHCPSTSGCRVLLRRKPHGGDQFFAPKSFLAVLDNKPETSGVVWLDSLAAVPFHMYTEQLLETSPLDGSLSFLTDCSANHFYTPPAETSEQCKAAIFSLTSDFNTGAFPCACDPEGSSDFACETFGGQCPCRENVIGRQCSRCAPDFYGFPQCRPCECGAGRQCHERTGQCLCPLHVEGQNCDKCENRAFGYDPLIGCQLCDCHPQGSEGGRLECDQLSGQCLCKAQVGGRKCDECLAGFYGFPFCHQCTCELAGSLPEVCDQETAACRCKENVEGQSCESCRAGTFHLAASNPLGCSPCFCFGTTDRCQSSYWAKDTRLILSTPQQPWTLVTKAEGVTVTEVTESIVEAVASAEEGVNEDVYFVVPASYAGQRIFWYGGEVSYKISSQSVEGGGAATGSPDAILKGNNHTLHYWSPEQPAELSEAFELRIPLSELGWKQAGGGLVSRPDFMMALHSLKSLRLKASYALPFKSAILSRPQLTSVDTHVQAPPNSPIQAASVEVCQCPPPYRGSSCEECADGFYRVKEGAYLGACVPCQCNGHAPTCDKVTGVCLDCQHGTEGEHCERCVSGHYGNATRGTPFDCQTCPCPHPAVGNNFASSCNVAEDGNLLSCNCTSGYAGNRCETCAPGFFGDPLQRGGSCQPCDCNNNNDLSQPGSCDPRTGVCGNCEDNTAGPACQFCEPWYYGDAVEAKNCTECGCDQCGSELCDRQGGKCQCRPLVTGDRCEKCVENAYGYSSCHGCRMCDCAVASVSGQCDDEGQCPCLSGVEGRQCDRCINGYWDYSATGCKRCDCEADLSQGTVCDVRTGQCQCQEGATGPRCDQCLPGYLRVPQHGCLFCDECVHVLVDDLQALGYRIDGLSVSLANVSTNVLVGAKLRNINSSAAELQPQADKLVGGGDLENSAGEILRVRDAASQLALAAKRSKSAAAATADSQDKLLAKGQEALQDALQRYERAKAVVQSIKDLEAALAKDAAATARDALVAEAKKIVEQLKAVNMSAAQDAVDTELDLAVDLLSNVTVWSEQSATAANESASLRQRTELLGSKLVEAGLQGDAARQAVDKAKQLSASVDTVPLIAAKKSMETESAKCRSNLGNASALVNAAKAHLTELKALGSELEPLLEAVNESLTELTSKRTDPDAGVVEVHDAVLAANQQAATLESDSGALSRSLEGTSAAAKEAVSAADAYGDIVGALTEARETAEAGSVAAFSADEAADGQAAAAEDSNTASMVLMREATAAKEQVVNNVTEHIRREEAKLSGIGERLKAGNRTLQEVKASVDMPNVEEAYDSIREKIAKAGDMSNLASSYVAGIEEKVASLESTGALGVDDAAATRRLRQTAKEQLDQANQLIPEAQEKLSELHQAAGNASTALDLVELKLSELRNKIAFARDTANRIQVGAKFEKGSSLQLRNPPRLTRSASNTQIVLHFRTVTDGLLFFFGNEAGSGGSRLVTEADYLAAEVTSGRPRVTMQLGDQPLQLTVPKNVRDGRWHRLTVERTGQLLEVKVETEGEDPVSVEGRSSGTKAVLNLHQTQSKFFVGGVPPSARMPQGIVSRDLTGAIEDIRYHGNRLGLWNFELNGRVATEGAVQRDVLLYPTSSPGVRLNGEGYVEMPMEQWNPRKHSLISFSFRTHAQDAVIFYMGKAPDFLSMELRKGQVLVQFDLGSGSAKLASTNRYSDGEWHALLFKRNGSEATLTIDNTDETTKSSPGDMFELGITDTYFVGGIPSSIVNTDVGREGFVGCITSLTLDAAKVNLNEGARKALGSEPGCPERAVRVVEFPGSDDAALTFPANVSAGGPLQLSLRFRTDSQDGLLASLLDESGENGLTVSLVKGYIRVESRRSEVEPTVVETELSSAWDGHWHYVSVERSLGSLALDVDDLYREEVALTPSANLPAPVEGTLRFGSAAGAQPLKGCLGDVTLEGRVLDFAAGERSGEVSLVGCSMAPSNAPPATSPPKGAKRKSNALHSTLSPTNAAKEASRCALPKNPLGIREDSEGTRFGLTPGSRFEYDILPEPFDTDAEFGLEFRATAAEGVMLFAGDAKNGDHIGLYLRDGHVVFSFNSGSGPLRLASDRRFLDGEWHRVTATKKRKDGTLRIDDVEVGRGSAPGNNYAADTRPPFYVGGVPNELHQLAAEAMEGVRWPFGGCLRKLQLNRLDFGDPSRALGPPVPCTTFSEPGLFFATGPAHAVLQENFAVGKSFSAEIELKPRTEDALILAATSQNSSDALLLQLAGGTLVFSVDNGAGTESISYDDASLCNGHWHSIALYKTKNIMTMSVDGTSRLKVMTRTAADMSVDTQGPLYLGGLPPDHPRSETLGSQSYVGCVRNVDLGAKPRQKRRLNLDAIFTHGDVNADSCPIN